MKHIKSALLGVSLLTLAACGAPQESRDVSGFDREYQNTLMNALLDAQPGDVILFSPACASFDQFRDYENRGDHFRKLVGVIAEGGDCEPAACPNTDDDYIKGEIA